MHRSSLAAALAATTFALSPASAQKATTTPAMTTATTLPAPPRAEQRPYSFERHGVRVEDPYAWLRDKGYPKVDDKDVLDYLKAENAYFEAAMKPHAALVETLFQEMKGRIKEDDASVPLRDGDWLYWSAFKPGTQYRFWYRKPVAGGARRADLRRKCRGRGQGIFPPRRLRRQPRRQAPRDPRRRRRLRTLQARRARPRHRQGRSRPSPTVGIGNPVWTSDSKGLVFTEVNDQWRSYRARYHVIGRPLAETKTLYEEKDDIAFSVGVDRSTDDSLIFISTGNNRTNEVRFVPADEPDAAPVLVSPRKADRQYEIDAAHGKLWVLTNDDHVNFRIATADPEAPGKWTTLDRRLRPHLSCAGSPRTATICSSPAASTGSISSCCAITPAARRSASRSPRRATAPASAAIPNMRRPPIGWLFVDGHPGDGL